MLKITGVTIAVLVLVLGGCVSSSAGPTSSSAPSDAAHLCAGAGLNASRGMGGAAVAAAFDSTAETIIEWAGRGRSAVVVEPLKDLGATTPVAFCYIDGTYTGIPHPSGVEIDYTRALFIVPMSGEPVLYAVGPSDKLPPLPPAQAIP